MVMCHLFYAEPFEGGASNKTPTIRRSPFSRRSRARAYDRTRTGSLFLSPFPFFHYTIPVKPKKARAIKPAVIRPMAVPW